MPYRLFPGQLAGTVNRACKWRVILVIGSIKRAVKNIIGGKGYQAGIAFCCRHGNIGAAERVHFIGRVRIGLASVDLSHGRAMYDRVWLEGRHGLPHRSAIGDVQLR